MLGSVGALATATTQGQLNRALVEKGYKQAPRVLAVLSGLGSIAAAVTGHEVLAVTMLGPACAQAGIESNAVDFWPAAEDKK